MTIGDFSCFMRVFYRASWRILHAPYFCPRNGGGGTQWPCVRQTGHRIWALPPTESTVSIRSRSRSSSHLREFALRAHSHSHKQDGDEEKGRTCTQFVTKRTQNHVFVLRQTDGWDGLGRALFAILFDILSFGICMARRR